MEITYQELSNLLIAVGLGIEKFDDNKYKIVGSNGEVVSTKRGAIYGAITYETENPNQFAQKAFDALTNNGDVLVGKLNSFSKRIVYSKDRFEIIPLSETEAFELNSDY